MSYTIVYTYKKLNYNTYTHSDKQKEWIIKSIKSARSVGYTSIELYTNDSNFADGLDVDYTHFIDDDYLVWDSFKIWVLENREDNNYFLSDSDIIYNKKINFSDKVDIYFDGFELYNWDWVYSSTMKYIKYHSLFKEYSFWSYEKMPICNVGILKIDNKNLKKDYIKFWKKFYQEILPHLDKLDKSFVTPILTQYLLTCLVNYKNYSIEYFTKDGAWPYNNEYYNHFCGTLKLKNQYII